jgi:hypothetical protein
VVVLVVRMRAGLGSGMSECGTAAVDVGPIWCATSCSADVGGRRERRGKKREEGDSKTATADSHGARWTRACFGLVRLSKLCSVG